MKSYPSISTYVDMSQRYHIFDKLDGSNIRAEWSAKRGFYKFGSRTQLLTPDQAALWPAGAAIEALAQGLQAPLTHLRAQSAVCFFEWAGPNSFAGSHHDPLGDMSVKLLDISVFKKGLLPPEEVLSIAKESETPTPALLHCGWVDQELLDKVRASNLPGMTLEGIIGKGPVCQKSGGPVMFKHKSQRWLDRLREVCRNDDEFRRLS